MHLKFKFIARYDRQLWQNFFEAEHFSISIKMFNAKKKNIKIIYESQFYTTWNVLQFEMQRQFNTKACEIFVR